jgi:DNA-binding NarL/FixJ family response regulator
MPTNIQLSPQERRVLRFIAKGLTTRQIASRMGIAWQTVLGYRQRLNRTFQLTSQPGKGPNGINLIRAALAKKVLHSDDLK